MIKLNRKTYIITRTSTCNGGLDNKSLIFNESKRSSNYIFNLKCYTCLYCTSYIILYMF